MEDQASDHLKSPVSDPRRCLHSAETQARKIIRPLTFVHSLLPQAFGLEGIGLRELPGDLAAAMASRIAAADIWGRNATSRPQGPQGQQVVGVVSQMKLSTSGRQQPPGVSPARRQPPAAGSGARGGRSGY